MNFEKLLAGRVFKNYNISRFYNNLLQVFFFVYAVLYTPSFTIGRLFYFLAPINFVTQPRYSQRSRKKCYEK